MSLDLFPQDIVVWKIKPEYSSDKNYLICTYYKSGHNTPRHFADRLFEGDSTPQLYEYIQNNKIDKIIFIVRHPFDRLLAGLKQRFISFANIGSINSHQESFYETSFLSDYMTWQSATKLIHDENLWKEWLSTFDWNRNLDNDIHTKKYLGCFEYFAEMCPDRDIIIDTVDMDAMTYYFATYGYFLPLEHKNGMSDRIDNYIMEHIKEFSLEDVVARHLNSEVGFYNILKVYNKNNKEDVLKKIIPKESYNSHYSDILKFYKENISGVPL